jgi:hypothetical protein
MAYTQAEVNAYIDEVMNSSYWSDRLTEAEKFEKIAADAAAAGVDASTVASALKATTNRDFTPTIVQDYFDTSPSYAAKTVVAPTPEPVYTPWDSQSTSTPTPAPVVTQPTVERPDPTSNAGLFSNVQTLEQQGLSPLELQNEIYDYIRYWDIPLSQVNEVLGLPQENVYQWLNEQGKSTEFMTDVLQRGREADVADAYGTALASGMTSNEAAALAASVQGENKNVFNIDDYATRMGFDMLQADPLTSQADINSMFDRMMGNLYGGQFSEAAAQDVYDYAQRYGIDDVGVANWLSAHLGEQKTAEDVSKYTFQNFGETLGQGYTPTTAERYVSYDKRPDETLTQYYDRLSANRAGGILGTSDLTRGMMAGVTPGSPADQEAQLTSDVNKINTAISEFDPNTMNASEFIRDFNNNYGYVDPKSWQYALASASPLGGAAMAANNAEALGAAQDASGMGNQGFWNNLFADPNSTWGITYQDGQLYATSPTDNLNDGGWYYSVDDLGQNTSGNDWEGFSGDDTTLVSYTSSANPRSGITIGDKTVSDAQFERDVLANGLP